MFLQDKASSQYFGGDSSAKNNRFNDQDSVMAAFRREARFPLSYMLLTHAMACDQCEFLRHLLGHPPSGTSHCDLINQRA